MEAAVMSLLTRPFKLMMVVVVIGGDGGGDVGDGLESVVTTFFARLFKMMVVVG